ncbi:hypothetical protein SKAU_G00000450 [Synaphobranchus kaupii]|uniref:Uncharacterized protein n=1 Tax=Synaphobranchus kaupii TaxID=118154 RepID=A0A9Q1G8A7_SYNKA|nr:hypothetical protein SKAU_G00000450 [Synaphobranchus kaupii]
MTLTEEQEEYLQDVPKELWAEGGHNIGLMWSAGQLGLPQTVRDKQGARQHCEVCMQTEAARLDMLLRIGPRVRQTPRADGGPCTPAFIGVSWINGDPLATQIREPRVGDVSA